MRAKRACELPPPRLISIKFRPSHVQSHLSRKKRSDRRSVMFVYQWSREQHPTTVDRQRRRIHRTLEEVQEPKARISSTHSDWHSVERTETKSMSSDGTFATQSVASHESFERRTRKRTLSTEPEVSRTSHGMQNSYPLSSLRHEVIPVLCVIAFLIVLHIWDQSSTVPQVPI